MRVRIGRNDYLKGWRKANPEHVRAYKKAHPKPPATIIGIDGEGVNIEGRHLYTYLAAYTVDECIGVSSNATGLTTVQCLELMLAVKRAVPNSLLVGFSLGYDYTKWLGDLPTKALYRLARPELRRGKKHILPVRWNGYSLNYMRGRFTVTRMLPGQHRDKCPRETCEGCKPGESVSVWDVWGFFQGSFIDACKNWSVISDKEYEYLKRMKLKRSTFTVDEWEDVKDYCGVECRRLAELVSRLRQAHHDADIPLSSYYGAGSTASSVLKRMGVKERRPTGELEPGLAHAVACAFFGGRFEISRFGPVREPLHSYDIASAYPYQLTGLPCLSCGHWRRVTRKGTETAVRGAQAALVRYALPASDAVSVDREGRCSPVPWGPFPLRTEGLAADGIDDGNIIYPVTSGGGWVYRDEYLAGLAAWPNVVAREAWVYHTDCDHRPFESVSDLYVKRLQWGKEGRGIVVKFGANSIYGKLAQSIGDNPPFQCFLWAGMITSGTRAQLLELIAQDPGGILMTATDGIVSRRPLVLPVPRDTGTGKAARLAGKEPLGGWESKDIPSGMMLIRPGIAFPLQGSEKETKARGIGKAVLKSHRDMVLESWEQFGPKVLELESSVFHGFKSSAHMSRKGYIRADNYGQWETRKQSVSYMPEPKRPFVLTGDGALYSWAFGQDVRSAPYDRIAQPPHVLAMKLENVLMGEQPDREEKEDEL